MIAEATRPRGPVGWLRLVVLDDLGTKLLALFVAVVLFVVARGEVVRTVEVPVRYVPDPTRVVLVDLPERVEAVVRGPWGAVARLEQEPLPPLRVRIAELDPGPLVLDPRGLALPAGVSVERLVVPPVDVAFEPVVERAIPVEVRLLGVPAKGFRVLGAAAEPATWFVRGAASEIDRIDHLWTEPVDVSGARADVETHVGLAPPPADVDLLRSDPDLPPRVTVRVRVAAATARRTFELPIPDPPGGRVAVTVAGPADRIDAIADPAAVFAVTPRDDGPPEVTFRGEAPADLRRALRIEHVAVADGPGADDAAAPGR